MGLPRLKTAEITAIQKPSLTLLGHVLFLVKLAMHTYIYTYYIMYTHVHIAAYICIWVARCLVINVLLTAHVRPSRLPKLYVDYMLSTRAHHIPSTGLANTSTQILL